MLHSFGRKLRKLTVVHTKVLSSVGVNTKDKLDETIQLKIL